MPSLISTVTVVVFLIGVISVSTVDIDPRFRVVCYWNSMSSLHMGTRKFELQHLKVAMPSCTHLIYGFARIDSKTMGVFLDPYQDKNHHVNSYSEVIKIKKDFPKIKILLSIGGNADPVEGTNNKYLTLIESSKTRTLFVESVKKLLNKYKFDGVDLAWQFPNIDTKSCKKKWYSFTSCESKEKNHRDGFATMVQNLTKELRNVNLTITVLPNIDFTVYYDVEKILPNIDAVHLLAFDQINPKNSPNLADYPAPFLGSQSNSMEGQISYWLKNDTSNKKVIVGIPAFARSWKLSGNNLNSKGNPPLKANGPGVKEPTTTIPGFLFRVGVCSILTKTSGELHRGSDPNLINGAYIYKPYDKRTTKDGFWIGYDDSKIIGNKAMYAKNRGYGGVAIYDLSLDDFSGECQTGNFPVLKAASSKFELPKVEQQINKQINKKINEKKGKRSWRNFY